MSPKAHIPAQNGLKTALLAVYSSFGLNSPPCHIRHAHWIGLPCRQTALSYIVQWIQYSSSTTTTGLLLIPCRLTARSYCLPSAELAALAGRPCHLAARSAIGPPCHIRHGSCFCLSSPPCRLTARSYIVQQWIQYSSTTTTTTTSCCWICLVSRPCRLTARPPIKGEVVNNYCWSRPCRQTARSPIGLGLPCRLTARSGSSTYSTCSTYSTYGSAVATSNREV